MRYIGNKTRLLPFILRTLERSGIGVGSVHDSFAGTASVSRALKAKGWRVHSSDLLMSSYVFQRAYVVADAADPLLDEMAKELSALSPRESFISEHFSPAAGLTTQALINEAILDIPHSRGGAIERGILAGGIGTTLFYITIGRNGSVSDISVMARTGSLSKTQLSLIFGAVSGIHAWRITRDPRYNHFFVRPTENGAVVGFTY